LHEGVAQSQRYRRFGSYDVKLLPWDLELEFALRRELVVEAVVYH
jgi:hypothetical protein